MNTQITNPCAHKQAGMTLVEAMIAITISLVLMAGVIQIFIGNRATYNTLDSMSRLQENHRAAMDILVRDIRKAGYPGKTFTGLGYAITGCDRTAGCPDGDAGDTITVSYDSPTDCIGSATPAGFAINQYYILNNNLLCLGNSIGSAATILVGGVEDMQFTYGEDSNEDGTVDYYLEAGNVALNMDLVDSVRIANLVVRTAENNVGISGDGRIRRTLSSVVLLRNRQTQ
ncbi:MAG: hypothetical protein A2V90_03100 [Gammaproteobacteria bacterium RBG_16_57_12]|nr:MAG: hypothetical protein A2V90_03100 [Gammaproteobacteria bacterium RBG_16_57_12]